MHRLAVALPVPLAKNFTYLCKSLVAKGTRVRVSFGNRRMIGMVLGESVDPLAPDIELKEIEEILDPLPILSPTQLKLAEWMSQYYLHPLGEVFKAMLPTAEQKKSKQFYTLNDSTLGHAPFLQKAFGKKKTQLSAVIFRKKLREWNEQNPESTQSLKAMLKSGCIHFHKETELAVKDPTHTTEPTIERIHKPLPPLNLAQSEVVDSILKNRIEGGHAARTILLHGVTGSGKTRVYLALIHRIFSMTNGESGQALVLVPEIALTPQMTRVFEEEFPSTVAVVHSALSDKQRWDELSRIRLGQARILIGPRSAVFASFQDLKIIFVDEEHDQSYKQSSGLTYNGRDLAVVRAHLEGITCLLGSATPSLESFWNVQQGKYAYLELRNRVVDQELPEFTVVDPPQRKQIEDLEENAADAESAFLSPQAIQMLEENWQKQQQAIILVNRRGYAYYLLDRTTKKPVECPECSISLTVHKNRTKLLCHYCGFQSTVQDIQQRHPTASFVTVGVGSQKAETVLRRLFPGAKIARLDSDVLVSREKLFPLLAAFKNGEIDMLVGTQILAKGHDFPNVGLTVICEIDQMLDLPDFRAGERVFQLVVQAAGRAGRAHTSGKVLIQTQRSNHPALQSALQHDYLSFAQQELQMRKLYGFPPFAHLIRIELSSSYLDRLNQACTDVTRWQQRYFHQHETLSKEVRMLGPLVPAIERIRSRYRRMLLISSTKAQTIHHLAYDFLSAFQLRRGELRIQVDVDPQSLL